MLLYLQHISPHHLPVLRTPLATPLAMSVPASRLPQERRLGMPGTALFCTSPLLPAPGTYRLDVLPANAAAPSIDGPSAYLAP